MRVRRNARGWILAACLALGSGAAAQSPADAVIEQLREQGYVSFEVSRTLLGRVRVLALTAEGGQREIVFNPASGEILRDYFEAASGLAAPMVLDRSEDDTNDLRPSVVGERDRSEAAPPRHEDDRPSRSEDRPGRSGGLEDGSRGPGQASGAGRGTGP